MSEISDLSLDDLRIALAPAVADAAVFDGWGEEAVKAAAAARGVSEELALYAFADGAMAMISAWIAAIDLAMAGALSVEILAALPIRERIRRLVRFRLEALAGQEETLRSALAIMAGDTAVDFNHYTKRATLAGIYAATLSVFMDDQSADKAETLAFLDRRIEGVMRFEKLKGQVLRNDGMNFSPIRLLGRLRYPAK